MKEPLALEYFSTLAQVIPVAVIVVIFELRRESAYWESRPGWSFSVLVVAVSPLLVAEFLALAVLGSAVHGPITDVQAVRLVTNIIWWCFLFSCTVMLVYVMASRLSQFWWIRAPVWVSVIVVWLWVMVFSIARRALDL